MTSAVSPTTAVPAEAALLDDFNADLQAKVTEAWQDFGQALAAALPSLPPGAVLELTLDPTASGTEEAEYSICITAEPDGMLDALAVGNAHLPEGYRLGRRAIAELVALGWSPPGVIAESGEAFGLRLPPNDAARLSVIVTRTMRDIYGAPHPAFLTYVAHANGRPVAVARLGTARPRVDEEPSEEGQVGDHSSEGLTPAAGAAAASGAPDEAATQPTAVGGRSGGPPPTAPATGGQVSLARRSLDRLSLERSRPKAPGTLPLAEQVALVLAHMLKTPRDQLTVDKDGDIGIRAGSAMVFVRVRANPPLVDVFSPVLTEIEPTEKLYMKLSELTNKMPIGRLYCANHTVWASVPVLGRDFQPSHLMLAVQVMTGLADELDDRLQGEFGGKRFFGEGDKAATEAKAEAERTGMYL